jgi:serine/threonine protein kinase
MKVVGEKVEFAGKAFYKNNPKNTDISNIDKEIRMVAGLNHPRIVKVYKKIVCRDYIIMLMERCYGGSLSNIMRTRVYLTEPEVRYLLDQIVDGLIYLKSKKIMHLDIKLSNILLDDTYQVKIADFGLA